MLEHRGFSVRLACEGQDLEEFSVNVDDERTISCYVPSEAGKTFSIVVKSNFDALVVFDCYADGEFARGSLLYPHTQGIVKGPYVDKTTVKPFQFIPLTVTDDEMVANPRDPALRNLGTIEVRFSRVKEGKYYRPSKGTKLSNLQPVHERCKKAGTHRVSYGDGVKSEKIRYNEPIWIDSRDQPYVTFRFRYRPRELLRAQGIITTEGVEANDEPSGSNTATATAETYESDSDIVVLDGPPLKKRRRNATPEVKPVIDVDTASLDMVGINEIGDDPNLAAMANQIRSLTKEFERKIRRKKRAIVDARVKKEKLEELDILPGEPNIIDLTES
ncbi:hypothetical protein BKA93DRAFT_116842 [Sparassis latifolia]|uniref:DUF7918 domain-containing protein n=1 Tax=Sparassis crispa TaxID=139825 RepID=A0A401GDH2_9APHY|nr:hypothetical protein SCP_0213690 [Sparassis crispa]GBE80163.1 hypothetical protein SCP_0213690 [Sparassis crispa]